MSPRLADWFPILQWGKAYDRPQFVADLTASAVVTLLLIPQSLAYAMLAGMPPVTGLYASIVPMVIYALMGSSTVLGPGPSALRSIMSLAAVGAVVSGGGPDFIAASAMLAVMVGLALLVMGGLRMGFMASFLSQPVLSGFITASGLLITMSQLRPLLGAPLASDDLPAFLLSLGRHLNEVHGLTAAVGLGSLALLWAARRWLKPLLQRLGVPRTVADLVGKASPLLVILVSIALCAALDWHRLGLAIVGDIPRGLPSLVVEPLLGVPRSTVQALMIPALLIAVMTFIEQISIAQGMAARRHERIDVNAEMRAMGGANLVAGLTGAFAVGASFSRTSVVAESGGRTPAAGIITAVLLALTALFLTPGLHELPMAVLAATILISLGSLLDFRSFAVNWRYARADFAAQALTFVGTLLTDLVTGLTLGVIASLALHIWRSSRPHIAVVGNVPGTEHYRNVLRHEVVTQANILGLRVDESLFFANARYLEDRVSAELLAHPSVHHVILQCTAINEIDASALESLRAINLRLRESGRALHLSEVKGPVMDRLQRSDFLAQLSGQVFLTHHQAVNALSVER